MDKLFISKIKNICKKLLIEVMKVNRIRNGKYKNFSIYKTFC